MKYFILVLMMVLSQASYSAEKCEVKDTPQDVNTPVPKDLEGATIIIKTKDGKERFFQSSEFKVVPRKQQFKIKERMVVATEMCPRIVIPRPIMVVMGEPKLKNLFMVGVRRDFTELDETVSGNKITLYSQKAIILDATYYRSGLINDMVSQKIGAGLGLDTNGTLRGIIGVEF